MDVYVARQPIYSLNNELFGYELLYRGGESKNEFDPAMDGEAATRTVLSNVINSFGVENVTGGHTAFVNFPRTLLLDDTPALLKPDNFIIEILEDTVVDSALLERLEQHHQMGCVFAMDDYTGGEELYSLLPFVDIIKVDFRLLNRDQRAALAERLRPLGKRLLAEKVETEAEYQEALAEGYTLFQGFYFDRPMLLCAKAANIHGSTCVRVFKELSKPDIDFRALAKAIRSDVNLTYKLLSLMNTVQYYRGKPVTSVQVALSRMGEVGVRRWITLVFIRDFTQGSGESIKTAFIRGLFAERVGASLHIGAGDDAFLTGILSMIDVFVDGQLPELLKDMCIGPDVKEALLGEATRLGELLKFVQDYEAGAWDQVNAFVWNHHLDPYAVAQDYMEAVKNAELTFE